MLKKIVISNTLLTWIAITIRKLIIKRKYNLKYGKRVFLGFNVVTEGSNAFANYSVISGSHIGYGSYIGAGSSIQKAKIGRYCSIGPNVNCIFGKHPAHTFVSTHPSFFSLKPPVKFSYTKEQLFKEFEDPISYKGKDYAIEIGNDVWIGANVSLMDGVKIGDGAIIAANTLVNKDVAPYSIIGGIPGKLIKKRFTDEEINFLLKLKWWNKEEAWIKANAALFVDIEAFYNTYKNECN